MSEFAPRPEQAFKAETESRHEAAHHKASPEHQPRHEKQEKAPLAQLEKAAKQEAVAGKELVGRESSRPSDTSLYVNQELRQQTWNRSMTRVRKHLSVPARTFSKVVHQPVVAALSDAGEKTIARPSGLLFGGICAFVGSSFFLYMAKHYGFTYNYLFFVLFFIGGFAVGLVIEAVVNLVRRRHA